jgi:hypothetical protein
MSIQDETADIYVYDGGRFHEVVIHGETFRVGHREIDQLLAGPSLTGGRYRNGCPPGMWGDYSRGCWRHQRPVEASLGRPCCKPAADDIDTWWDEIPRNAKS